MVQQRTVRGVPLAYHRHKPLPAQWWSTVGSRQRANDGPTGSIERATNSELLAPTFPRSPLRSDNSHLRIGPSSSAVKGGLLSEGKNLFANWVGLNGNGAR